MHQVGLRALHNASLMFMHYITSIFADMIKDMLNVFMDDFSIYEDSFIDFLANLERVLE